MTLAFDPDAAAKPGSGMFGLPAVPPFTAETAHVVLIPVPFDATTSYGGGASGGPEAIRAASAQVDLHDRQFGDIYQRGIAMLEPDPRIVELAPQARSAAAPIIEKGGAEDTPADREAVARVDAACERVNDIVEQAAKMVLHRGQIPGLVGGDHSTPFGIIKACAEHAAVAGEGGLGILHFDAHMDLREAFEGFTWSHASIMHNVMSGVPGISRLVQVGLRDVGSSEIAFAERDARIKPHMDLDWQRALLSGDASFRDLVSRALGPLPQAVYVSFDIDVLDPSLCPGTGTPVPGGLSFAQVCLILEQLRATGRRVVGFDLVEVAPSGAGEWDANVGARVLYKLCGVC